MFKNIHHDESPKELQPFLTLDKQNANANVSTSQTHDIIKNLCEITNRLKNYIDFSKTFISIVLF